MRFAVTRPRGSLRADTEPVWYREGRYVVPLKDVIARLDRDGAVCIPVLYEHGNTTPESDAGNVLAMMPPHSGRAGERVPETEDGVKIFNLRGCAGRSGKSPAQRPGMEAALPFFATIGISTAGVLLQFTQHEV
ncbi:MAG: hypothetical protein WBJ06_06535 [Candidatus Methanoculleus thermohydrogenotrophicum]